MNKLPGWMILVESLQPCGGFIPWGWTIWQTSCWVLSGCNKFNIAFKSPVCCFFHQILVSGGLFFVSFARSLVAGNRWNYTFPEMQIAGEEVPVALGPCGRVGTYLSDWTWRWHECDIPVEHEAELLRRFQLFIDFQQKEVHRLLP